VVPTDFTKTHYPEYLVEGSTRRLDYLRKMHQCLVGVDANGLHNCVAWKLGEYLAGSLCIVAKPIRDILPVPLTESNALTFYDPQTCVAACDRLLSNPALAAQMREDNYRYYREFAQPSSNLWNCLVYAFDTGKC
jgi:hypothetical protein